MGEVNGWVTQTALAIRDEDELEAAASLLDAALQRAKAEGMRAAIDGATSLKASVANGIPPHERVGFVRACNELIGYAKARAAQIEEGE